MTFPSANFTNTAINATTTFTPPSNVGTLGTYSVEAPHAPWWLRAKASGGIRKHWLTYREVGQLAYQDLARKGMLPTTPQSQTSQGAQLRSGGIFGTLYDYTLGVLESLSSLVEEEAEVETVKPGQKQKPATTEMTANGRSVYRPSMESFLEKIEGKFTCMRGGLPCLARPGEPLQGTVILGWEHAGISEQWGEELIADLKRPGDKIVVEYTQTELEDEVERKTECMGFSKEDCIPGEIESLKDPLKLLASKNIELQYQILAVLDPEAASGIWQSHRDKHPYELSRLLIEQYVKSYPVRAPHLSAEQTKEFNRLFQEHQEQASRILQGNEAREQNYIRILEWEIMNRDGNNFVAIGSGHVKNMRRSFSNNDKVITLMPARLGEPRRNPRLYG